MENRPTVQVDRTEPGIGILRLDRPERNLLNGELVRDLTAALDAFDRDPEIDAIVLGSTSPVFSAGADLAELRKLSNEEANRWLSGYFELVDRLRDTGKPTVAAVEGDCVAGGNELAMGCDLIVAGESARFGQPEVVVGSTAAGGGLQLLPLIVGEKRAREMLLTGELLGAEEAERYGLVNRVVDDGEAESAARELARTVIESASPQAYRTMKAVMKSWTNLAMHHREMARELTAAVWTAEEFDERAEAFLAGRDMEAGSFTGVRPEQGD